jgi:hypothetical protein
MSDDDAGLAGELASTAGELLVSLWAVMGFEEADALR